MKTTNYKFKLIGSLLALGLLLTGFSQIALARSENASNTTKQVSTDLNDEQTLGKRLQDLREKHQIRLTILRERIISDKCRSAQGIVSSLNVLFTAVSAKRERIYTNINARLDLIIVRLDNLGVDTSSLKPLKQTFERQLADLMELFDEYRQILSDLEVLDCREDPASFQAALEEAKDLILSIKTLTHDFHTLIKTELREELIRLVRTINEVRSE